MASSATTQLRLGEVLIDAGYITNEQLQQALTIQKESGGKLRVGEVLIENNIITEENMLSALATRLKIKFVSINDAPVDLEAVVKIPRSVASKYSLIAIAANAPVLRVNMSDPLNYYAIEDVKLLTNMQIEVQACKKAEILRAINESYSEIETQKAAKGANKTAGETVTALPFIDMVESADDTPVVTLINSTLYKAHSAGASDIHIEPFEEKTQVRIRVDGQIVDYLGLSASLHNSIVARVKILSGLDIAEKRVPQDGHFRARLQDIEINVRVSTLPTVYGEKLVLRFINQNSVLENSETFGMERDDFDEISRMLQVPHGIIYITGPTGSGKTTTLYMIMEMLAKRMVNIATIEDPVEKMLARVNQTQINPPAGLTFDTGLRAILRQDPDVILIGETRDSETAATSVRAALTGHLVLSSLHTNDSVSAIVRLIDMGVEDYLLANSLVGVVAQRLVKKICAFCYEEYEPSESELRALGHKGITALARGRGCHNCNNTGYKGRVAVHEILNVNNAIRTMITRKAPTEDIYAHLREGGRFKTLRVGLLKHVLDKKTTAEELLKLTYFVE